jgi:glycosyltransferase involved in cell wall biosynthesis
MIRQRLLEFLIPAYKRFDGAVNAAESIARQIRAHSFDECVTIRIVDDGSPDFSCEYMTEALAEWKDYILIEANHTNKGMSLNIYDMVASSTSEFCTILTDDDWLFPGALPKIIDCLARVADNASIGGIFTPRYSYLEDGSLYCVVCQPFKREKILPPGPVNSLRYCHNGFILTGFMFRPSLMAKTEWRENIGNSFFPVINFWAILSANSILFVNRNWFQHTVLNVCHWEAWGDGPNAQRCRLYTDYMDAIAYIAERSCCRAGSLPKLLAAYFFEAANYFRQIVSYLQTPAADMFCISPLVAKRNAFQVAVFLSSFHVFYLRLRHLLGRRAKAILKGAGFG